MLQRVRGGAFAAPTLNAALAPLAGAERAHATDVVYGVLRYGGFLDAALAPLLRAPDKLPPLVREALRAGAYEKLLRGTPAHAAVHAWVEATKAHHPRLGGLVNAVLRRLRAPPGDPARLSTPPWLAERLAAALGAAADRAAAGMLAPEPLWLTSYRPEARATLEADGCAVDDGPLPHTLRVQAFRPLAELHAFREGMVQPQNPAATVPVRLLDPQPGERVYDLASGNGIKSAQLAAAGARVTALEVSPRKLARAARNLERLGLSVEHQQADLRRPPPLPPVRRVLLDAPCSGTGTLRGHPEIKLRLTPDDVATLAGLQAEMLASAAALTAPGGRLVYAVCALTPEEGDEQLERFVAAQPDFRARPLRPPLPHVAAAHGAYLVPEAGLDGFYLAVLERDGGPGGGQPA